MDTIHSVAPTRSTHDFYLIQRLTRRGIPDLSRGFDGIFQMDYMGSSEFEWGAPGDSLRRIRATPGPLVATAVVVTGPAATGVEATEALPTGELPTGALPRTVWVVGTQMGLVARCAALASRVAAPRWATLERSYFLEHLAGVAEDYMTGVVAWWSLDDDCAWTLDETVAADLVVALTPRAAS